VSIMRAMNDAVSEGVIDDLTEAHARAHGAVIEACVAAIAALTTLDLAAAGVAWRAFLARFEAHARIEEEDVFPACAEVSLAPKGDLVMLARDHALLRHAIGELEALREALADAAPEARRGLLARHPDPLVRLLRALEHHLEREHRLFYPIVARALGAERARAFAALFEPRERGSA